MHVVIAGAAAALAAAVVVMVAGGATIQICIEQAHYVLPKPLIP